MTNRSKVVSLDDLPYHSINRGLIGCRIILFTSATPMRRRFRSCASSTFRKATSVGGTPRNRKEPPPSLPGIRAGLPQCGLPQKA